MGGFNSSLINKMSHGPGCLDGLPFSFRLKVEVSLEEKRRRLLGWTTWSEPIHINLNQTRFT